MTHTRRFVPIAGALLAVGLIAAPPARASDAPTPEERALIEAKPRGMGFERWGEIERENDGREWGVDDARLADGRKFEVRLAAGDSRELRRRPD